MSPDDPEFKALINPPRDVSDGLTAQAAAGQAADFLEHARRLDYLAGFDLSHVDSLAKFLTQDQDAISAAIDTLQFDRAQLIAADSSRLADFAKQAAVSDGLANSSLYTHASGHLDAVVEAVSGSTVAKEAFAQLEKASAVEQWREYNRGVLDAQLDQLTASLAAQDVIDHSSLSAIASANDLGVQAAAFPQTDLTSLCTHASGHLDAVVEATSGMTLAKEAFAQFEKTSAVEQWREYSRGVLDAQFDQLTASLAAQGVIDLSSLSAIASASNLGVQAAAFLQADLTSRMAEATAWQSLKPAVDTLLERWEHNSAFDAIQAYFNDAQALYREPTWKRFIDDAYEAMNVPTHETVQGIEASGQSASGEDAVSDIGDAPAPLDPAVGHVAIAFGFSQFLLEVRLKKLAKQVDPLVDESASFHEQIVIVAQAFPDHQCLLLDLAVRIAARLKWTTAPQGSKTNGACEALTGEDADEFKLLVQAAVAVIDAIEDSRK